MDENNSKHHSTSFKKTNEIPRKNKIPVTVILRDTIMKDVWKG